MFRVLLSVVISTLLIGVLGAQCPIQHIDHPVRSIDLSRQVAFIGVPSDSVVAPGAGAVEVYEDTGSTFTHVQTLRPASSNVDEGFGRRLSVDGDWAMITSQVPHSSSSSVYFFHRTASGWVETQSVSFANESFDGRNSPVAIRGDRAIAARVRASGRGHIRIYQLQAGTWTLTQEVTPHLGGIAFREVELAQGSIWGTAPFGSHNQSGAAFIYDLAGGQWEQTTRFTGDPTPDCCAEYGKALDSDGTTVVVGSHLDEGFFGAAYIYEKIGGQWTQVLRLESPEAPAFQFGYGVSVNGDVVAIGSPARIDLWQRSPSGWAFDESLLAPFAGFFALDLNLTSENRRALIMSGASNTSSYVINFDSGEPPFNYCTSTVNTNGTHAMIRSTGYSSISGNDLGLRANNAVPNSMGLFFYGNETRQAPFGDGARCVGGTVMRLLPALTTSSMGHAVLTLDLAAPPFDSGPGHVTPGSAWRFQFWYRDGGGMSASGFNTTDALEVTFCP
ncbi:MAG: hypothetical protein ACI8QZ_003260 [Chlamydiales bacterium]|jgi:hypothetical protein